MYISVPDKPEPSIAGSVGSDRTPPTVARSVSGSRNTNSNKKQTNIKTRSRSISGVRRSSVAFLNEKAKVIVCPFCGTITEIPLGGLVRLPQNYVLMRQIEKAVTKTGIQQVARIWCFLCSGEVIVSY